MKICKISILLLSLFFFACNNVDLKEGKWSVDYNDASKTIEIGENDKPLFTNLYAAYQLDGKLVTSKDYESAKISSTKVKDNFGIGSKISVKYSDSNLPNLVQSFYLYADKDYILTDFTVEAKSDNVSSNYMAPINIDSMPALLNEGDNRALFIPFDNDKWVRFQSHPLGFDQLVSYEVTAVFNNESRQGLVVGSVEHDNWKSGIALAKGDKQNIGSLKVYGGVADTITRDVKAHGSMNGKSIKSPKVMIGLFSDWRNGLEKYAEANATVTPPRKWNKSMPVGWNSWGALQFDLTYQKALEVSDFFKANLQNNSFTNADNTVTIGLDSGWNSFTEEELKSFVKKCHENGQIAGIYWTPFTDWGRNPEKDVEDAETYKYKDIYVYANGEPQELDGAFAIDPTHPAIEARMKKTSELFRRCGFEYVKMDFMTHGAMEGDKWHKADIQTGMQAYNYGMQLLDKYFHDMYLNLSISPIFPAQYAQSRRIACDAWNKIKDTEYSMNAVSYGWWIDGVYTYNDADHIVLRDATEGENRARITSGVITGLYIAGDDFSLEGPQEAKNRAKKYLTNKEVNAVAKGISFRPIEGNGEKSEAYFYYTDEQGDTYFAAFNYSETNESVKIPYERLNLSSSDSYQVRDLWSNENIETDKDLLIPAKDVRFMKISKK